MKNQNGVIDWAIMGVVFVISVLGGVAVNEINQARHPARKPVSFDVYEKKPAPKTTCWQTINKGTICVDGGEA